jgi:hypothetical protein
MVDGRWLMVDGRWSMVDEDFVESRLSSAFRYLTTVLVGLGNTGVGDLALVLVRAARIGVSRR